jgi:transcriptional regulator with XRE-family HTH domain
MDIILAPNDIQNLLAEKVRKARLASNLTQSGLASRAGVSLGSLKRFEQTGDISLSSLAKLAFALRMEHDFEDIFSPRRSETLDELLAAERKTSRKRGRLG